jgi:hypothetical protein
MMHDAESDFERLCREVDEKRARENALKGNGPLSSTDVRLQDFVAYMPMHNYIFTPTRDLWPASSVNARIPPVSLPNNKTISASAWLDANAPVEQMTWAPGEPMLIKDRLISEGGWIARSGCTVFNVYQAPTLVPYDAAAATPWLNHAVAFIRPKRTISFSGSLTACSGRKRRSTTRWYSAARKASARTR